MTGRVFRRALVGLGLLAAGGFSWGVLEARAFTVRQVSVPVLAAGASPLRVLHLSDIHLLSRQRLKQRFVASLAGWQPDLVVNTGDNIASTDALDPLLGSLGPLLDVPGVFVFGSNDYCAPSFTNPLGYLLHGKSEASHTSTEPNLPWRSMRDAFARRGWTDLTHRRTVLDIAGTTIEFRGTDDAHLNRDDYAAVAGPPRPGIDLSIGVTHAPYLRLLDAMTTDGVDLIMAGHTHGGQVCLPVKGALITNCDLDTDRVKGLSTHSADGCTAYLHVSAGIGGSPFAPYRTFCRPEATLLTLVPRD